MVEKQIQEDRVRQLAMMNLAHQFNDASIAKDELWKAYEECRDIPLEQRAAKYRKPAECKASSGNEDQLKCKASAGNEDPLKCKASAGNEDPLKCKASSASAGNKGPAECKASTGNLRGIQVKDIVQDVEDYLKTYSSAEMKVR
nr:hypothetical protein [Tanacetum cinerariifolium]